MADVADTPSNTTSPWAMSFAQWRQVLKRTWTESNEDNVGLISAGVAFYGFLALVPLLGAIVLSYGLVAEPKTVIANMQGLTSVMPADAAKLIGEQLMNVVKTSDGKKGLGLLVALGIALFGARNGATAIMTALNVAYEEKEKRGLIALNLYALAITLGAVLVAIVALVAIAALGHLETLFPGLPGFVLAIGKIVTYLVLALFGAAGAATLYRYGPSRAKAKWVWLTPGSLIATLLWLALTLGFGVYVANFGNYNATYGSLGAVVVMLTWLYLSSYILVMGGELNSELEHQTTADTTTGAPAPLGTREAWVADHVAGHDGVGGTEPTHDGKAASAPAPAHKPGEDGKVAALAASRFAAHMPGTGKVGLIASVLSTWGLSMIRGRRRTAGGVALVAAAAALARVSGKHED